MHLEEMSVALIMLIYNVGSFSSRIYSPNYVKVDCLIMKV